MKNKCYFFKNRKSLKYIEKDKELWSNFQLPLPFDIKFLVIVLYTFFF